MSSSKVVKRTRIYLRYENDKVGKTLVLAPRLFLVKEVATHFGVDVRVLRALIRQGKLPYVRFGPRTIRLDIKDFKRIRLKLRQRKKMRR